MAIRITNSRETNLGAKANIYGRPLRYSLSKQGVLSIEWEWLEKDPSTLAEGEVQNRVLMFEREGVSARYNLQLTESETNTGDIPALSYSKVVDLLKTGGNSVESDESGAWLAV